MEVSAPKYSEGDVIKLKTDETFKRVILFVYDTFYDETGLSKERYYCTTVIDNSTYSPSPMKESIIDKYYTKING
jgi:hypothetical protein